MLHTLFAPCVLFLPATAGADVPADDSTGKKPPTLEERITALEAGAKKEGGESYKVYWKDGMRFESPEGDVKIRLGGRIQLDMGWFTGDDSYPGNLEDGTEFRRARLYLSGEVYEDILFMAEYDFADGEPRFKDVYMGCDTQAGVFLVGHFKEPFCLEEVTGDNYITFMERSTANAAFAPSRNTGFLWRDASSSERVGWGVSFTRTTDDFGENQQDGAYDYTARITGLPLYSHEGADLVHLGLAYSLRTDENGTVRFNAEPEQHLVGNVVDTGAIPADGFDLIGGEAAWVSGPFSLQGEYMRAMVDDDAGDDPDYFGWYAQASWFLTGEHRAYEKAQGIFGRVKPKENYGKDGGSGAWELAARYSALDLDDGPSDDTVDDVTLGVNWYLNPNTRVMLNYVHSEVEDGSTDSDADLLGLRIQMDF